MKNLKFILGGLVVLALLGLGFCGGYKTYPYRNPCPVIQRDTIYVYDTLTHEIPKPYPVPVLDTVYLPGNTIPQDVDTAAILKDYYSYHAYNRTVEDSNIRIAIKDTLSKNNYVGSSIWYTLLKPSTTIVNTVDNRVYYNKYVTFGFDAPIKNVDYSELEVLFVAPKWYGGLGYTPIQNSVSIKAGMTLFKFK